MDWLKILCLSAVAVVMAVWLVVFWVVRKNKSRPVRDEYGDIIF